MLLLSLFSRKEKDFNQKSLEILKVKGITPEEILGSIRKYNISDLYGFLNNTIPCTFLFLSCKETDDYLHYFTDGLDIIQEFESNLLNKNHEKYSYIFNITINKDSIKKSCEFLAVEGIKNPITFLKNFQYHFFDTSKALERIKEKNEYLKNHPYITGKKENTLNFRIESSWLNSLKTLEAELEIYKKCEMIDYFLSSIKRFGLISEGEKKLELFTKFHISNTKRNIFLKKYFNQVLTKNCSVSQLEETLSHWDD